MNTYISKLPVAAILAGAVALGAGIGPGSAPASPPVRSARTHAGLTAREAANRHSALALLQGAFAGGDPRAAAEKYIDATTYIQHNPQFGNGREAFITSVEAFVKQSPQLSRVNTRTVVQGDLVVVEGSFKANPSDRGTVVVDTFRFNAHGKIVEHWDALQAVAASTLNGNPQV